MEDINKRENGAQEKPVDDIDAHIYDAHTGKEESAEEETENLGKYISHFQNTKAHLVYMRYGFPFFLACTITLLISPKLGTGVSADYILLRDGEVQEQRQLLVASIISTVHKLRVNKSYPLAILIAATSIAWPYMKLLIALCAWFIPYQKPQLQEFLNGIIEAVGKWSFVDIIVLVDIMVAFQ